MHSNKSSPLTDIELKEAFAFYAEIFNSDDAKNKFSAASTMLFQLDKYLKNKIEGLDTFPILAVLEEYAHIQNGRQAKFIKPDNNEYKQTPISSEELKNEYDKLKEVFLGTDSEAKYDAASNMMMLITRYLGNNIQSLDVYPITMVLAEFARISEGGEAEFLKSHKDDDEVKKKGGKPIVPLHHVHDASIVSSVDILAKNGYSVAGAIRFVASELGRKESQIDNLRSNFNRRQKNPQAKEFKRVQSNLEFLSEVDAKIHVLALLKMVKLGTN